MVFHVLKYSMRMTMTEMLHYEQKNNFIYLSSRTLQIQQNAAIIVFIESGIVPRL